jgi:hypothetical protein
MSFPCFMTVRFYSVQSEVTETLLQTDFTLSRQQSPELAKLAGGNTVNLRLNSDAAIG